MGILDNKLLERGITNYSRKVLNAWSDYINKGSLEKNIVRPEVLQSWKRSKEYSVDPYQNKVDKVLSYNHLKSVRDENDFLLSIAEPKMKALAKSLYGTDTVVTMADKNGVIFNTFGDSDILLKSEGIGLVPGSIWSEEVAGTNAVGIALSRKKPIQVLYSEHFSTGWHSWSSNAAPIFHPLTKELIGVFDIAGMFKNISRQTLELAKAQTHLISTQIISDIYQHGISQNPYLSATFQAINDPVLIINAYKETIKINQWMESLLRQEHIDHILQVKEIKELVDYIFKHKEKSIESDIVLTNARYSCKILPILIDMNISGVIIRLKMLDHKVNLSSQGSAVGYQFNNILGKSAVLMKQISLAKKAAQIDTTLFISGESGTGKEIFAQSIHNASHRKKGPFVAVNCGAIPANLIESELFGYEAGSFTGADSKGRKGKFEQAQGGTIFLDEIGDMPLNVQVQLLRVLEEKVITRIGGQKPINLDVRVIAATHKNLLEELEEGRFRHDLYYRIQGIQLSLPPLRLRGDDIIQLAYSFIEELSPQFNKRNVTISDEASMLLLKYNWPGNLRELKNVIQQTLFNLDDSIILPHHLPEEIYINSSEQLPEKDMIIQAIKSEGGHMSRVAARLNISRATLYRKLQTYQLSRQFILQNKNDS